MLKKLSFFPLMYVYMGILGIGAAVGTFIENDYGTEVARELVYNALWYEIFLALTVLHMMAVIIRARLYRRFWVFLFHIAFAVILIGAGLTRYFGFEGQVEIREGESTRLIVVEGSLVEIPFEIHLVDFQIKRYPGSRSPSSYLSHVFLGDGEGKRIETKIAMNQPVDHLGYRIFQASYPPDELGSVFSLNRDPGKEVTYVGYALLFLGLLVNLFHPKSRLRFLISRIDKAAWLVLFGMLLAMPVSSLKAEMSPFVKEYLEEHKLNSVGLGEDFGRLMVQSRMGRTKPLDTLAREVLRKLSGRSSLHGLEPSQVVLGILTRPKLWEKIPIVRVKAKQLKETLGITGAQKLSTYRSFFDGQGKYKLSEAVDLASAKVPFERNEIEKEILKLDERVAIFLMVQKGTLLKIFPLPEDFMKRWFGFRKIWDHLDEDKSSKLEIASRSFIDEVFARRYEKARTHLESIKKFQVDYGSDVFPDMSKVEMELLYHRLGIFPKLSLLYLGLGLVVLVMSFWEAIRQQSIGVAVKRSVQVLSAIMMTAHGFGLGLRAYVSGHMPLSDTYESLVTISFFCLLAGLILTWRSIFVTSSSLLMSGIFLFVAHLNSIDPEITNLVPVLKSFWLSVHVSVITSSYGFFGIACFLGAGTLTLLALPLKKAPTRQVKMLTDLNEAYIIIGLTLLVIGNFLGAIWANESWGRYWGWDPKETWAYISIITYVLVLHLRMLKKLYSEYLQASCSTLAFSTILMTYFGVNFYLSGKHSYATGDPILIPVWAYVMMGVVFCLIFLAGIGHRRHAARERASD